MSPVYFSLFYRDFETISAQWQLGVFGLYSGKLPVPLLPTGRVNGSGIGNGAVGPPRRRRIFSREDAGWTSDLA